MNEDSDYGEESGILEISWFERAGLSIVTQLKRDTFFACTQKMPQYPEVRQKWEKACVKCHLVARSAREEFYDSVQQCLASDPLTNPFAKVWRGGLAKEKNQIIDQPLVLALLCCWLHAGLWLYSRQDRLFLLKCFFGYPAQAYSADAFRQRCKRLGLIGWNDFPSVYPEAPLCYRNRTHEIREPWVGFFERLRAHPSS